ncbi:uncharacterized protein LOC125084418 [Lutra lutra]|uniref:uncharacterized protein LOC125084418 n=1 Tax=Lutra lutra TaxID=9657 RepID=UPI001FD6092A|nr:uncharacterized protein LOC125084418 [Lutra lutra]
MVLGHVRDEESRARPRTFTEADPKCITDQNAFIFLHLGTIRRLVENLTLGGRSWRPSGTSGDPWQYRETEAAEPLDERSRGDGVLPDAWSGPQAQGTDRRRRKVSRVTPLARAEGHTLPKADPTSKAALTPGGAFPPLAWRWPKHRQTFPGLAELRNRSGPYVYPRVGTFPDLLSQSHRPRSSGHILGALGSGFPGGEQAWSLHVHDTGE